MAFGGMIPNAIVLIPCPPCCPFIVSCHSLFLVLSSLTSFRSPSLASCQYFALLLTNFDHLCPCSSPDPFFCPSFTWIVLIFLSWSPRVPSLWSFSLASATIFFFVFLLPPRSPSSIEPCQSFFLVPLPSSLFSLISVRRSVFRSLRFSSGPVVPCTSKKYAFRLCSLFVPAAFRSRLLFVPFFVPAGSVTGSGRVSFSFHFRSGRIPVAFPFRSGCVPFSFSFRSGRVQDVSTFRFALKCISVLHVSTNARKCT